MQALLSTQILPCSLRPTRVHFLNIFEIFLAVPAFTKFKSLRFICLIFAVVGCPAGLHVYAVTSRLTSCVRSGVMQSWQDIAELSGSLYDVRQLVLLHCLFFNGDLLVFHLFMSVKYCELFVIY